MNPLDQHCIDYLNTFDWASFVNAEAGCVPGTWENCCDDNGLPVLCLGETQARASLLPMKGVGKCSGCSWLKDAIAKGWTAEDCIKLAKMLK